MHRKKANYGTLRVMVYLASPRMSTCVSLVICLAVKNGSLSSVPYDTLLTPGLVSSPRRLEENHEEETYWVLIHYSLIQTTCTEL